MAQRAQWGALLGRVSSRHAGHNAATTPAARLISTRQFLSRRHAPLVFGGSRGIEQALGPVLQNKFATKAFAKVHVPEVAPAEQYDMLPSDLFRQAAQRNASLVALDGPSFKMTYAELDHATDCLAAFLRTQYQAVPETVVGIYMERCEEYVIALLAAWKAGAAYCPIELAYPGPLRQAVIDEVQPRVILTKTAHSDKIPTGMKRFYLDEDWQAVVEGTQPNPSVLQQHQATKESLSYVIYSGGSTGRPKGIEASFRSNMASYLWRYSISGYQPGSRVGCNVFFVWEVVRPLLRGGTAVIIPDDIIFDTVALASYLEEKAVTEVLFTPSLFETLLRTIDAEAMRKIPLQVVWFNGEVVTTKLVQHARRVLPDVSFCNTYSISECGEAAAGKLDVDREDCPRFCSVGKPAGFANHMLIHTETGEQVLKGTPGELWLSGPGVGRGYTNNPAKTAEVFVEYDGEPWYRTGDLARELHDGALEILGRCDFMVKVRGYSIVLGAVETAINQLVGVSQCCVVAKGEEGTDKRLAAYLVPCEAGELRGRLPMSATGIDDYGASPAIVQELLKELPHYAVPAVYVELNELPLNKASMKTNRAALPPLPTPPPVAEIPTDFQYVGSESQIQMIFEEILNMPAMSLTTESNFFEVGGHSLLVTRLLARVAELGGPRVSVVDFVRAPTVSGFASLARGEDVVAAPSRFLPNEVEKYIQNFPDQNLTTMGFWRYAVHTHNSQRILLTGATGYVGAHILARLLRATASSSAGAPGQVFCVVRSPTGLSGEEADVEARARVLRNLEVQGHGGLDLSRLRVVAGDVSLLHFGMEENDYRFLQQIVDVVIHAAANVNLTYSYDLLEPANVFGTSHTLEFARGGKMKALHYISTNAVFPESGELGHFDEHELLPHHLLSTGYAQTKWVAEQMVLSAGKMGLPVAVYRLGNVAGPLQGSGWNESDSNLLFLRACLERGAVPEGDWAMELTPVDFISEFVVNCMMDLKFSNAKTFNLINKQTLSMNLLESVATRVGFPIHRLAPSAWCAGSEDAEGLLSIILGEESLQSLLGRHHTYRSENVEAACQNFGITYPDDEVTMLSNFLRRLVGERLLPSAPAARKLDGQVAVVTGASSGIGLAICRSLAAEGAIVILVARSAQRLAELTKQVEGSHPLPCDVTSREQVHAMMAEVKRKHHRVDILVNCAGVMHFTLMKNLHYDDWAKQIDVNCHGTVNVCGAALPIMLKAQAGHIVNISSDAAKQLFPALTVYNASKAFVNTFSRGLRAECVGTGLRVTDVQPGDTATNLLMENRDEEAAARVGVAIKEVVGKGFDRASILEPEDVASAVLYAVTSPPHVGVHEIVIEPRDQMYGDPTAMGGD